MSQSFFQTKLGKATWLVAGAIALGSTSCSPTANEADAPTSEAVRSEDTLQVVTTILPMTQFATAVAGDRAEVAQLLPTNTGPHDYQAKPADVQAIANADVLIKNGLEVESFLDDMIENAENADLAIVDTSEGISTLASSGEHHEGEHHDGEHGDEHHDGEHEGEHHEGEGHEGEEHAGEHAHGEFDPHVWLDPKRAVEQVENIRDGLIAVDPEGESEYTANAEAFIAELTALDADISQMLSPFAGETFVILHDFAAYFADSYELEFETLVGLPEENPSPDDVKRVIETVQTEDLNAILAEPQIEEASFEAISNDLGVTLGVFNPLETGDATATQPDYYLETMRQNAENLVASFETTS